MGADCEYKVPLGKQLLITSEASMPERRIGLIGFGAIGSAIADSLENLGESACLAAVLVRTGRGAAKYTAVHTVADLVDCGAEVVIECAGQGAVAEYGPQVLAAGLDLVVASSGALADPGTLNPLSSAAAGGGQLLIAAGAVSGLDGLLAARLGGLREVTYTSWKPPAAWRGTAAEASHDLDDPGSEQLLFEGTARKAALTYPKNANVAVTVALCGLGLDATVVRLFSSRDVSEPLGVIEARGGFGHLRLETLALASPANSRTSLLTAYSLLQCVRLHQGLPALALLGR